MVLADHISATKCADPKAHTSGLEREIDELVYQLYGLTEEEINIVEGGDENVRRTDAISGWFNGRGHFDRA